MYKKNQKYVNIKINALVMKITKKNKYFINKRKTNDVGIYKYYSGTKQ